MDLRSLYDKLITARRPRDFFGDVDENGQKALYRAYCKLAHPDSAQGADRYIAGQAFALLSGINRNALAEFAAGTYGVTSPHTVYGDRATLFEFEIDGRAYKFYEHIFRGGVADLYGGTNGEYAVIMKAACDPADNALINTEFNTLYHVRHHALPIVEHRLEVDADNRSAFVMREIEGVPMPRLMEGYRAGVPAEHVMWMLERLLSVTGYLHANKIVHGNITPEHIIINKQNHNVSLCGFSMCIPNADAPNARYKIKNEIYSPPEVGKNARVTPSADVYAIGKAAVLLLGGDAVSNAMPLDTPEEIRTFIRTIANNDAAARPDDAWKLWDDVIRLRAKYFKNAKFKTLE